MYALFAEILDVGSVGIAEIIFKSPRNISSLITILDTSIIYSLMVVFSILYHFRAYTALMNFR